MNIINQLKTNNGIILNSQQVEAVQTLSGATLLLAVPGSGKTTVIIARLGVLILEKNVPPEQILTLTFSVKAANDMQQRFVNLFGNEYEGRLQFRTIHSFCYTVIKEYEKIKNTTAFDVIENNSHIIKSICIRLNEEYVGDEVVNELIKKICYCKNLILSKEAIKKIAVPGCDFLQVYEKYEAYKKAKRIMDYDDMLNYAYIILKRYPNILQKYQEQFKFINVDEAQDISFIQHEIIRLLAMKNKNIFMVGDEDQSIYGFRAASPKELLSFEKKFSDVKILKIEQNYRSTRTIVEVSNSLISHNKGRYFMSMYCEKDYGQDIKITKMNDLNEQYDYLVKRIRDNNSQNSIAIIYRNNDSSIPIVDIFEREKIQFSIRENNPAFFSHFLKNDFMYIFQLALNNNDSNALEKIYYKLKYPISKQMVEYVKGNKSENVFDTLLQFPNLTNRAKDSIKQMVIDFRTLVSLNPYKAIQFVEWSMGYKENIETLVKQGYSIDTLNQKLNTLKVLALNVKSIQDLDDRLVQLEEIMQNETTTSNVTLTTIHSSKGLEFDTVIIVDAIDGQIPSSESIQQYMKKQPSLYEEEVRLMYVAITRAKDELEVIYSDKFNGQYIKSSRFINYIIQKSIDQTHLKSRVTNSPLYNKDEIESYTRNLYQTKISNTIKNQSVSLAVNNNLNPNYAQEIFIKKRVVTKDEIKSYTYGTQIKHKVYGKGCITNFMGGGTVEVKFTNNEKRILKLVTCLEEDIIYKI